MVEECQVARRSLEFFSKHNDGQNAATFAYFTTIEFVRENSIVHNKQAICETTSKYYTSHI